MEFDKRYLLWGAGGLAGLWIVSRFVGGGGSVGSAEDPGPSIISYVSPGGGNLDSLYGGMASQSAPGAGSNNAQSILAQAAADSAASTQNILNTDSLLTRVTEIVGQQQSQFGFSGKYGFATDIQGAIDITKAGSPAFTLKTEFTPKDPSNAAKVIDDLTGQVAAGASALSGANAQITSLSGQLSQLASKATSARNVAETALANLTNANTYAPGPYGASNIAALRAQLAA